MQLFIIVHITYTESLRVIAQKLEVRFSGQAIESRARNVITQLGISKFLNNFPGRLPLTIDNQEQYFSMGVGTKTVMGLDFNFWG